MTCTCEAKLWHQCLSHPGLHQFDFLPKHSSGLPSHCSTSLHAFHKCSPCIEACAQCCSTNSEMDKKFLQKGSIFHMDFGFLCVSSSTYTKDLKEARIVKSHDGFNSYLLIVDSYSHFVWNFLTASKYPPIDIVSNFLQSQKLHQGCCNVMTDLGGELGDSNVFQQVVAKHGYQPTATGANFPYQNGLCEHISNTLGIFQPLLYSSGLSAIYWSDALLHSVYLYNIFIIEPSNVLHEKNTPASNPIWLISASLEQESLSNVPVPDWQSLTNTHTLEYFLDIQAPVKTLDILVHSLAISKLHTMSYFIKHTLTSAIDPLVHNFFSTLDINSILLTTNQWISSYAICYISTNFSYSTQTNQGNMLLSITIRRLQ